MQQSEETKNLAKALLDAQKQFTPAIKDRMAKIPTRTGGSYSYSYADLAAIMESCIDALQNHGVLLQQEASNEGAVVTISTRFTHVESGEWQLFDGIKLSCGGEPQSIGSAITYGRRYSLMSAIGIVPDDDDGAAAQAGHQGKRQSPPAQNQQSRPQGQQQKTNQQAGPAAQSQGEQKPKKTEVQKLRDAFQKIGCKTKGDVLLVANWATTDGFTTADEVFASEAVAKSTLARLKDLNDNQTPANQMLSAARACQVADEAFAE